MSDESRADLRGEQDERYLWDRGEPVDPTVRALEDLLRRYALHDVALRRRPAGARLVLVATAAVIVVAITAWLLFREGTAPSVAPALVARLVDLDRPERSFAAGETVFAADSRLRLRMDGLGEIVAERYTQFGLDEIGPGRLRLRLDGGRLEVNLLAGAREDAVVLRSGALTCTAATARFALDVEGKGGAVDLRTLEGMAMLRGPSRLAMVPAGARVGAALDGRVDIPFFEDASPMLQKLLSAIEDPSIDDTDRVDYAGKFGALVARKRDTLSLWHLLVDRDARIVKLAEEALVRVAGVPPDAQGRKQISGIDPGIWRAHLEPLWR